MYHRLTGFHHRNRLARVQIVSVAFFGKGMQHGRDSLRGQHFLGHHASKQQSGGQGACLAVPGGHVLNKASAGRGFWFGKHLSGKLLQPRAPRKLQGLHFLGGGREFRLRRRR